MSNLFLKTTRFVEILIESQTKKIKDPTVEEYDYCTAPSTLSNYISTGVQYHPDYTVDYDIKNADNVIKKTFNDNPDLEEVFENFMNNSPYRSVWVDSDCDGTNDALEVNSELTFSKKITVNNSKTVNVGLFGDNKFTMFQNGDKILDVPKYESTEHINFAFLHIFPVTLIAGENILSFQGIGDGSINDALGVIIYDNSIDDLLQPIPRSEWNVIFSSEETLGNQLDIVSCPEGYSYNDETNECVKITDIDQIEVNDYALISPTNLYDRDISYWEIYYGDDNMDDGLNDMPKTFEYQYKSTGTYNVKINLKYSDGSYSQGKKQIIVS